MKKRHLFILLSVMFVLVGCTSVDRNDSDTEMDEKYSIESVENSEVDDMAQSIKKGFLGETDLSFYGVEKVDDNPWGYNAGLYDIDQLGQCLFLTPDTAVNIITTVENKSYFHFTYGIYPDVKETSDGAEIWIDIYRENEDEVDSSEKIIVASDSEWENYDIDISDYRNEKIKIVVRCLAGESENRDADWVLLRNINMSNQKYNKYWKSVHYFADEWPLNFWNSEWDDIDNQFERIKNDEFNSIILVVPWREFQPSVNPITYNQEVFKRLDMIVSAAQKHDLGVVVRIGYTWDFYDDTDDILERYYQLVGDETVQKAWYDYVATLYKSLSKHDNFWGGFITWEDFWNVTYLTQNCSEEERSKKAEFLGFTNWLKQNYTLDEINRKFAKNYTDFTDVKIPNNDEPMKSLWYEWYDSFLYELLQNSQKYFYNLSMEVRTDWDLVNNSNGEQEWYDHTAMYPCGESDYTSAMYGIPQGCLNQGERLDSDSALEKTNYILSSVGANTQGKKIYVEQFLFTDNTLKFSQNAQIEDCDIPKYLENVDEILKNYTMGYGIWTYKDYRSNMIYNAQFALGLNGWRKEGNVLVKQINGSKKAYLEKGSSLEQIIESSRNHYKLDTYIFEMDVQSEEKSTIFVNIGNQQLSISVNKGNNKIHEEIAAQDDYNILIKPMGDCYIDNVKLYSFVQKGKLYNESGEEDECIKSIRILNSKLEK